MGIKAVKELPETTARKTYKEKILDDIKEALDNKIDRFEFTGDYKYKHLRSYAKVVTDEWLRQKLYDDLRAVRTERGWKITPTVYTPKLHEPRPFNFISVKEDDRIHVYCEIDRTAYEWILKKSIEDYEERMAKREAKEND